MDGEHPFRINDAPVLWYCAEACRRQGFDLRRDEGIMAVARFLVAWGYALSMQREREHPEQADVIKLARLVHPEGNRTGLRLSAVEVAGHRTPPYTDVPRQLDDLLAWADSSGSSTEWYREFQRIHPLRHANWMVGAILMNWIAGSLRAPFFPEEGGVL